MNTPELEFTSEAPEQTESIGLRLGRALRGGDRIFLLGDLGGGKTTFTRGVLAGLLHPDPREVASPTFALHHRYEGGRLPVDHLDLYRTDGSPDLSLQGLLDPLDDPDSVTLVEWAERISWWERKPDLQIEFHFVDATTRRLVVSPIGERGRSLVGCLA